MKKKTGIIFAAGIMSFALTFTGCANKTKNNDEADYTFAETGSTTEESSETTSAETTEKETTTKLITTTVTTTNTAVNATIKETTTANTAKTKTTTTKAVTTEKANTNILWNTNKKAPALTTVPVTVATINVKVSNNYFTETTEYIYTDEELDIMAKAGFDVFLSSCEEQEINIAYLDNDYIFNLYSDLNMSISKKQLNILIDKMNVLFNEARAEAFNNELGITFERNNDNMVTRIQKNLGADGAIWTHTIELFDSEYQYYNQLPRYSPTDAEYWTNYIYENEGLLNNIAGSLLKCMDKYDKTKDEMLLETVRYVQAIPYKYDIDSTGYEDYPRYPYETLYDNCGDCEDVSFLLAGLLRSMGYGVCTLYLPGHAAVGVRTDSNNANFYLNGLGYYYIECTNEGWAVGEVPEDYSESLFFDTDAYILDPID